MLGKGSMPVTNPHGENQHGGRVTGQQLIADIRRVADERGETPTATTYDDHGRYSRHPIRRRFGGWNAALQAAGLPLNKEHGISENRLLRDVELVAIDLDRVPSFRDYLECGHHAPDTVAERFGGWDAVLEAAALEVKGSKRQGGGRMLGEDLAPEDIGLTPLGERKHA